MSSSDRDTGILFLVSAPSGTGKTSVLKLLLQRNSDIALSVSHTTRKPRESETNGIDYHFISRLEFEELIERGEFLEYAQVHGNYYGTSRTEVLRRLASGHDLILDIDVQGYLQLKESNLSFVSIFLLPPSFQELHRRLVSRGTENSDSLRRRISAAKKELEKAAEYNYLIVNDILNETVKDLETIISAEHLRCERRTNILFKLTSEPEWNRI